MLKRNIILLTILFIIILGAAAGAFLYLKDGDGADLAVTGEETGEFGTLFPTSGERTLPGQSESIVSGIEGDRGTTSQRSAAALSSSLAGTSVSNPSIILRGTKEVIRYFESKTGHLYEIGRNERVPLKLSNTTIPGIREVLWAQDDAHFVIRYEERETGELINLLGKLTFATSSTGGSVIGEITGGILPSTVTEVAANPSGTKLFYLNKVSGGSEGIVADFENKNQKRIFSSPISEWNIDWASEGSIFLTTKAASKAEGITYKLDASTGKFTKVLSGISGLVTLGNSSGNDLFISESTERGLTNSVYSLKENLRDDFPFFTLPEKCTWSIKNPKIIYCATPEITPAASYPDEWYQGKISFDDSIWEVNALEGGARLIYDPQNQPSGTTPIDAIHLTLNTQEDRLYFKDKRSGQLRFVDIPNPEPEEQATTTEPTITE